MINVDTALAAEALSVPRCEYTSDNGGTLIAYGAKLDSDRLDLSSDQAACAAAILSGALVPSRLSATKWYAFYRITVLAGMTPTAQANWQSAMLRLTNIRLNGGTLTADQEADLVFALAADAWKNETRIASDEIERRGISPFSDEAAALWPPLPDPATVRPVPKYV